MKDIRQRQDHFFKQAKKQGYPARSVYKLKEIDQKYNLIRAGDSILDLGCAPGSWMIYAAKKTGAKGKVFGIDLKKINIALSKNITFRQEGIEEVLKRQSQEKNNQFDVILSDMAPETTGIRFKDAACSLVLAKLAFSLAEQCLKPRGNFLCKVFESEEAHNFLKMLRKRFVMVKRYDPKASRKESKEFYIIAKNYLNQ